MVDVDFLKIKEASLFLGVSRDTLYRMIESGKITYYRVGAKAIRIKKSDLIQFVENGKAPAKCQ